MSKMGQAFKEFLDDGGTELGYTYSNPPKLVDFSIILENNIQVWIYNGYPTAREFYEGDQ